MGRINKEKGVFGEKIAEKFILSRKFLITDKNFRTPFGEIDFVARDNNCIVFFEVKTRTSDRFGPPSEAITRDKARHIIRNCEFYLKRFNLGDTPCRIDIIAITLGTNLSFRTLRHIKNALGIEQQQGRLQ